MEELISPLVNAIYSRISIRKYRPLILMDEDETKLRNFLKILKVPFDHSVTISLKRLPKKTSANLFINTNAIAIFSAPTTISDQAKVGFIGELFILYCVSIGLGTCWIGHFRQKNVYKLLYDMSKDEAPNCIHCITPLGYPTDTLGFSYKIFSKRKKTVEQNLHEESLREFPDTVRTALELACKAPSAMNSQCWYFKVLDNKSDYIVEISKPDDYKHFKWPYTDIDVGTSAAHCWLGLKHQNVKFRIILEDDTKKAIWKFIIAK